MEVAHLSGPGDKALVRAIGRWDLAAILVNVVIGAGILGLPAKTFALLGVYSIAGWLLCALIMGLVAACFAELGSRFTQTGGPYLYAYVAFGPATGFVVGWLAWVSRLFSFATITNLALNYAGGFAPVVLAGPARFVLIVTMTTLLTIPILVGVRRAALVNNVLTACKLVLLVGFALVGLARIHFFSLNAPASLPSASAWQSALMMMSYAFLGIESAMITSGETRNPRRDVPFALAAGLAILALLYLSIQVVCIGTLPDLASSQRPVVDAAERILGPWGGWVINIGALVAMLGTLFAILLTGSRLPFAFAERGQLPPVFEAVHGRFKTPHVAILVTAVCSGLFALYSSFLGALTVSALTRLVGYVTTCAAMLVLRRRRDGGEAHAAFRVPGGPLVATLALLTCVWLMLAVSKAELWSVAVILLVGIAIGGGYTVTRRRKRRSEVSVG